MLSNFHSLYVNVLALGLLGYEKKEEMYYTAAGKAFTTDRSLNKFIMVVFEKVFLIMLWTKYSG